MTFSDNFCMQKLIFQAESMSQCPLKKEIGRQKWLKIGRLLFLIISVCPNFLQLSIHSIQISSSNTLLAAIEQWQDNQRKP